MKRLAMGAALGGLAVYLYDPELGEERRERLLSLWRENRESAVQVGRSASQAAESARPLARRMTKAVGRTDWAQAFFHRPRRTAGLPALIGAAVIGGVLVYFLDSSKGSERRKWLLAAWQEKQHSTVEAGRQAARQTVKTVQPVASRVGDQFADAVAGVKSTIRSAAGTVTAAAAAANTGGQPR
jgi:gas vesicle protein